MRHGFLFFLSFSSKRNKRNKKNGRQIQRWNDGFFFMKKIESLIKEGKLDEAKKLLLQEKPNWQYYHKNASFYWLLYRCEPDTKDGIVNLHIAKELGHGPAFFQCELEKILFKNIKKNQTTIWILIFLHLFFL